MFYFLVKSSNGDGMAAAGRCLVVCKSNQRGSCLVMTAPPEIYRTQGHAKGHFNYGNNGEINATV